MGFTTQMIWAGIIMSAVLVIFTLGKSPLFRVDRAGAAIVARWGVDALMAGPFSTVQRRADGAAMLLLAAEPDDQGMSRKSAAEFLGIRLRPLYAKVADGARVELPWR